ncbi:MAG TPA: alpha/beta hydrolase [Caulobacteraceae bacterium]|nr:alpha/beta hydrolase [Caulobacteraceae bacterium]
MALAFLPVALAGTAVAAAPSPAAVARIAPAVVLADAWPPLRTAFAGGVVGLPDLTYAAVPGYRPLKLDLYLPPAAFKGPRPVIVYVHGGGWVNGTPRTTGAFENWPQVLAAFAARGYVVAALSYRLAGEQPFPAAIHDVKAGIRWLRANAAAYRVDKGRVLVWGTSSGGELAAVAAVSCGVAALEPPGPAADSDCVQAAVTWYGGFDFAMDLADRTAALPPGASPRIESPYMGCSPCTAEQLRAPSATTYLDAGDPPMLLIHGTADRTAAPRQSQMFYEALRALGIRAELVMLPGIDHSLIGPTPQATRAAGVQALERTLAFADATIGDKSSPPARPQPRR